MANGAEPVLQSTTLEPPPPETVLQIKQQIAAVENELTAHRSRTDRSLRWALEEAYIVDRLVAVRSALHDLMEGLHGHQAS